MKEKNKSTRAAATRIRTYLDTITAVTKKAVDSLVLPVRDKSHDICEFRWSGGPRMGRAEFYCRKCKRVGDVRSVLLKAACEAPPFLGRKLLLQRLRTFCVKLKGEQRKAYQSQITMLEIKQEETVKRFRSEVGAYIASGQGGAARLPKSKGTSAVATLHTRGRSLPSGGSRGSAMC